MINEQSIWDKSHIDTTDTYDMEYWSTLWGISKEQILEAITYTESNTIDTLEKYLVNSKITEERENYPLED